MPKDFNNWTLTVSRKIYGRLLLAYPKAHREEYGPAMMQLFRDQCRDAWNEARGWGLVKLWLRVLPDLAKTSIIERLSTLTKRKSMSDKMASLIQPRGIFLKVFVAVFLAILCCTVAVTFMLPESYASTAQIKIEPPDPRANPAFSQDFLGVTFSIIRSDAVLKSVIDKLNLNAVWGKKFGVGTLKTSESMQFLENMISLKPVRNTSLIDITVFSADKNEAPILANAIAESYRDFRVNSYTELMANTIDVSQKSSQLVEITKTAKPSPTPARPNKPLNIAWGIVIAILMGLAIGAGIAGIAILIRRKSEGGGRTPRPDNSTPQVAPTSTNRSQAKVNMDKIMGLVWMGISGFLSSLGLIVLFLAYGDISQFPDSVFILLLEAFWGGNVVVGFFLFRGKFWARICIGTEAILLTTYFLFIGVPLVPHLFRWMPIVFMAITACGLFLPRKQTSITPR